MTQTEDSVPQGDKLKSSQRYRDTVRVTVVGAIFDTLLGVVKLAVGFIAQSQALVADGIHSLSDLVTDIVVLYAAKHSHQEADEEHPYGHGRFETLATVALGMALIGVAIGINIDAGMRLVNPSHEMQPGFGALLVALISIGVKEAIYHYTMAVAVRHNSNMLKANAWHSRTDAISSVIVVVGIAGSMLGYPYLDPIAAIGVGLMIAKIGWDLAWSSVRELVDTGLEQERLDAIRNAILDVDGVKSLHILRTRRMASEALVDVHILVDEQISVSEGHYISETVRLRVIKEIEEVADVMVHIDPEDDEVTPVYADLPLRHELQAQLKQAWQGLTAADYIDDITLHYLDGRIRLELTLPLSLLGETPREIRGQLQSELDTSLTTLTQISLITLLFR